MRTIMLTWGWGWGDCTAGGEEEKVAAAAEVEERADPTGLRTSQWRHTRHSHEPLIGEGPIVLAMSVVRVLADARDR